MAFRQLKRLVEKVMEQKHFGKPRETRIVSAATDNGLGALFEQPNQEGWQPILFASWYLNASIRPMSLN